ncbi:MAG: M1 family metallopeptidase, partial [Bacteroidetes bacterium]|nr:M1 family metallopeptidase [Bacteroidota bacterium]
MKLGLSILLLLLYFSAFSQSNSNPYSCYSNKKGAKYGEKSALDNRSDTLDIESFILHMDVQDWNARNLVAKAELQLKALKNNVGSISLDLLGLSVDSVKQNAQSLNYTYNDTLLVVQFANSLALNSLANIEIFYHGTPVQNAGDWGGFYWNNTYAFNIGVSFLEDPHNYGRVWFPCFDNFVERALFEYYITTSANRKAFCGGLLIEEIDNVDGSKTWHWRMSQEIPSYLASMAVSDYQTLNSSYTNINNQVIPIQLAARAADTTALKNSFLNLNNALECFETSYAPYAWDRVGYCLSSFNSGAMEHACNINYMRNAVTGSTANETLMAHELSHHWWGNLITCSKAEDMWLNEGWASYSEALFTEFVYGTEAYKDYSRDNHDKVLRLIHINDGAYYPVSGVPSEQTYSSTVYDKGADMAHTIRGILGDSVFFNCLNSFLLDYSFQDVSSTLFQ